MVPGLLVLVLILMMLLLLMMYCLCALHQEPPRPASSPTTMSTPITPAVGTVRPTSTGSSTHVRKDSERAMMEPPSLTSPQSLPSQARCPTPKRSITLATPRPSSSASSRRRASTARQCRANNPGPPSPFHNTRTTQPPARRPYGTTVHDQTPHTPTRPKLFTNGACYLYICTNWGGVAGL